MTSDWVTNTFLILCRTVSFSRGSLLSKKGREVVIVAVNLSPRSERVLRLLRAREIGATNVDLCVAVAPETQA